MRGSNLLVIGVPMLIMFLLLGIMLYTEIKEIREENKNE